MSYDIIHFEALGKEANYLEIETNNLIKENILPKNFNSLITPLTVQEYLSENNIELPEIITTKTHSILPEKYINSTHKNNIITRSAGYDHLEEYQDKLNIASLREYCVNAVAQTALKFGLCTCGLLNEYIKNTQSFERNKTNSFIEISKNRIVTVYGVGKIGSKVYQYFKDIGFTVQAVDIRSEELKSMEKYKDFNFVCKEDAILESDIIVNVMNLTKIKDTKKQSTLTKEERKTNVKDAFVIRKSERIVNKKVILFDDIFTTGNTVNECSKVIKMAGAKEVAILTIAVD